MAKELTALAIEKIKPSPTRREIPDGRVGGLYFVVQPSGKRSWAVRYRHAGKPCKFTIGQFPAIDLKTAREMAGMAKDKVEEGKDPGAEKKAAKAAAAVPANDLIETVAGLFLSRYAKRQLKARTAKEVERLIEKEIVKPWRGWRLSEIRRPDIHELLDDIVERGSPVGANRTFSWFRRMCTWAIERGLTEVNPCLGIKAPAPETARDRILNDDELAAVWRATEGLGEPYSAFVKLLILTSQRLREIAEMRRQELDLDAKIWTLPAARCKNGREHQVPLPDQTVEIIRSLPRIADSEFVFTLCGRGPITAFALTKGRIDAALPPEMPAWTFHDIRRTFASGCARLGVDMHVVEKCLNHVSGSFAGIVGVYQRHDFGGQKRVAMAVWARHIDAIVSGEPANVIELARA